MISGIKDPEKAVVLQTTLTAEDRDRLRELGRRVYGIRKLSDFMQYLIDRELNEAVNSVRAKKGEEPVEEKVERQKPLMTNPFK